MWSHYRLGRRRPETMPASNWWANRIFSGLASLRARTRLRDVHSGQRPTVPLSFRHSTGITEGSRFP